uniref:Uncharacterized protein n=1 Tax=Acrobeloides nanus TaxID=290746 RepID=A0A914C7K6_9BILA
MNRFVTGQIGGDRSYQTPVAKNLTNWNLDKHSLEKQTSQEFSPRKGDRSYQTPKKSPYTWFLEKYTRLVDQRNRPMEVMNTIQNPLVVTICIQRRSMTISCGSMLLEEYPLVYNAFPHVVKAKDVRLMFQIRDQRSGQANFKFRVRFQHLDDFNAFVTCANHYFSIMPVYDTNIGDSMDSLQSLTQLSDTQVSNRFANLENLQSNNGIFSSKTFSTPRLRQLSDTSASSRFANLENLQSSNEIFSPNCSAPNMARPSSSTIASAIGLDADNLEAHEISLPTTSLAQSTQPGPSSASLANQDDLPFDLELDELMNDRENLNALIQTFLDDPQCCAFAEACAEVMKSIEQGIVNPKKRGRPPFSSVENKKSRNQDTTRDVIENLQDRPTTSNNLFFER